MHLLSDTDTVSDTNCPHPLTAFNVCTLGLHMDSCVRAETPSAQNRKCIEFATAMPASSQPRAPGAAVMVEYGPRARRRRTLCYRRSSGSSGWCGTCLRGAAPGEYGHCADGMPPPEDDDLVTRVRPSKHWGFCSELCRRQEMAAHRLMVTLVTHKNNYRMSKQVFPCSPFLPV